MWKEGKRIHFVTKVKENGTAALEGGYVDLHLTDDQVSIIVFFSLNWAVLL